MKKEKIVYSFNPITREFTGNYNCQPNPLVKGQFLMPANATEIEPPTTKENEVACFIEGKWKIFDDYRKNQVIDIVSKVIFEIQNIGSLPENCYIISNDEISEFYSGKEIKIEDGKLVFYEKEKTYSELRQEEYPPFEDYLDAQVKLNSSDLDIQAEGQKQLEKYYSDCLSVKEKYPSNK